MFVGFGRTPSETKKFFKAILAVQGDMKREVGVVDTALEELSLKRICAPRV